MYRIVKQADEEQMHLSQLPRAASMGFRLHPQRV